MAISGECDGCERWWDEEGFVACVSVYGFGDADNFYVLDVEFFESFYGGVELIFAAVDDDEVWPKVGSLFRVLIF